MRGNPFSFKGEADSFVLTTLAVPKSCFRLEREQLLTAALPFARFFLHCSESNVTRNDERRVILSACRERIRNPLKRKNGLPRTLLTLAVPKSCFRLEREQLLTAALPFVRFILHCRRSQRHSQ